MIKPEDYDMSGEELNAEMIRGKKEEVVRAVNQLVDRLGSMLGRIDSVTVSEQELTLIRDTIIGANQKFDELAGTDEWMEALKESNK